MNSQTRFTGRSAHNNRNRRSSTIPNSNRPFSTTLSHSESTQASKAASHKVHNFWRISVCGLKPMEEALYDEFDGENLQIYFFKYCIWLATTPIPTHRKEGTLLPTNPDNKKCLTTSTLVGYLGNTHCDLKLKFPYHPDFSRKDTGSTDPSWYSSLRQEFICLSNRKQMEFQTSDDMIFGGNKTLPIYRSNAPPPRISNWDNLDHYEHWFVGTEDAPAPSDIVCTTDLRRLNKKSIQRYDRIVNPKCMAEGCLMNITYHSACRGGEPKFLNWNDCYFDPGYHVFVFLMSEVKTMQSGRPTPMVPDSDCPYTCIYHALGRYLFVGDGLVRTEQHEKSGCVSMVFPFLWNNHSQRSTADVVTEAIRNNLPKNIPKDLALCYSSKSLRQGSITAMANHPKCGIFEVTGRSGHALNITVDFYNQSDMQSSLPGAIALAGYPDVRQPTFLPRWECLGSDHMKDMVQSFIASVAGSIHVPILQPGQRLYPLITKCVAILVVWHNKVTQECGDRNPVSVHLKSAARNCSLKDARWPDFSPEMVLERWSQIMFRDQMCRNQCWHHFESNLQDISSKLNNFAEYQHWVSTEVEKLRELTEKGLLGLEQSLDLIRSGQHNKIAELETQCVHLRSKVAFLRTPDSTPSPHKKRARVDSDCMYEATVAVPLSKDHLSTIRQTTSTKGTTIQELVLDPILKKVENKNNSELEVNNRDDDGTLNLFDPHNGIDYGMSDLANERLNFIRNAKENPNVIMKNGVATQLSKKKDNRKIHGSSLLLKMKQAGYFPDSDVFVKRTSDGLVNVPVRLKELVTPEGIGERAIQQHFLDLVEFTLKKESALNGGVCSDWELLFKPYKSMDIADWEKSFHRIVAKAFKQMYELEKIDMDIDQKKKGRKKTPTFIGLGNRVKEYKKLLVPEDAEKNGKRPNYVAIDILDEVPKSGTPKGNRSIARMFGKK